MLSVIRSSCYYFLDGTLFRHDFPHDVTIIGIIMANYYFLHNTLGFL